MKVQSWLLYELELFTHITRNFYMTEFLLTGLRALGRTVLIGTIIMGVGIITMVEARVAIMIHSEIRAPKLAVMWWTSC